MFYQFRIKQSYKFQVCWAGLPPHLLQAVRLNSILVKAVAKALDMMIKAEVTSEIHLENLLNKHKRIVPSKPALSKTHHPIEDEAAFEKDSQTAAVVCNLHQHSSTCHKGKVGKKGCRLSRPQALVKETSCCQIEHCIDAKGKTGNYTRFLCT